MRESKTLLHRLSLWSNDAPAAPAHYYKDENHQWQSISVKSFWLQVVRIALSLQKEGIQKGDRVLIYAMNSPEWIHWEMGIWLAGAISVGIHPNTHPHELEKILDQVKASFAIVESEVFKARIPVQVKRIMSFKEASAWIFESVVSDEALLIAQAEVLLNQVDPKATQIIIFTSGTTGVPKGVMLGLEQLGYAADCISREWNFPYADGVLFSFLPLSHVAEKIQSLSLAITQRYQVWFASSYERFMEELKEVRPTLFFAVPRVWERMKEKIEEKKPKLLQRLMEFEKLGAFANKIYLSQVKEQLGLDRVLVAVSGAVKLAPSVAEWFSSLGIPIQEIYGMSESTGLITLTKPGRKNFYAVGKPPLGVEVKIASDGEIWLRGAVVFQGYFGQDQETHQVLLEDGWLKTGDLGEWSSDQLDERELIIIGRNREIIKLSNGRMVAPSPLENVLKEIPEVSNVCIVGEGKPSLMALISMKDAVLMEYKFIPGAVEGLSIEDAELKKMMAEKIKLLFEQKKLAEKIHRFVLLSREFSIDQKEMTSTQKMNRNQIQKNFRYFIDLKYLDELS